MEGRHTYNVLSSRDGARRDRARRDEGYALKGIRVLDFTWVHAGPAATRVLADQGAQVIKIESGLGMPLVSAHTPQLPRQLGLRHNYNAGKLSLSLNMHTPQGIDIARRLVAVSDVVAENFSSGVMLQWGLDYPCLSLIRPDIVMLSMSGMGHTGRPWKDYVTYGPTLQAWSGFTTLTGFPDTVPCGPASAYSDATAGMAGAQAVLLALVHRARTGQGQWIDLSQLEALSALLETLVLDLDVNRREDVHPGGNRLPDGNGAPHGAYRCRGDDRWVAIAVFTNEEWQAFVQTMGGPAWALDGRFSTATGRHHHADDLDRLVESWTSEHTAEEVMHRLQGAGVAAGVVQSGEDMVEKDPQLRERGFFISVPDAQGTPRTIEAAPYKLSHTPGGAFAGAPDPGAHQDWVLRDILGMSDEELAECAIQGVFD